MRRFWARPPDSTLRPRLFDLLYPWIARSPAASRGLSLRFWARGLDRADAPTFSHDPRWTSAAALQRFLAPDVSAAAARAGDPVEALVRTLPDDFARWHPLGRAQYLEIETLLSPYILSSQGDRVLMAHSVEGRFPFLDADVMALANALPPDHKLFVLREKYLLKRAAMRLVPDEILSRPKQPYRAPDAVCFVGPGAPDYVDAMFSPDALRDAGLFEPTLARSLYEKVARTREGALSNADNMAFLGILSAQLVHHRLVREVPDARDGRRAPPLRTLIDRCPEA